MQKRGLSTIIVTLILILVSLVAVGIIWVVVRNVIQTGTEGVGLSQFSLSAKILDVAIDNSSNNISLTVKRNAGEGELIGISFVFSSDADTEVITRNVSLKELEQMNFYFHLNTSVSDLISVSIVPLIKQDEKQITGIALDKYNLGKNQNAQSGQTACTPTNCSILGYVCGTWNNGTCSGTLSCGNCTGGQICNASGRCVANGSLETQDFEGVTFPPTGWITGGDSNWYRNITGPLWGTASAASGSMGNSQKSWLSYNRTFNSAGYVSFLWNVSSEDGYDFLCFCLDKVCGDTGCICDGPSGTADVRISSTSGGNWVGGNVTYNVNAGSHNFVWCYSKDSWTVSGLDMGKVDSVFFN